MLLTPQAALTAALVAAIGAVSGYVAIKGGKELTSNVEPGNLVPMSPENGPPFPRGLNIHWPWKS